MVECSIVYDVLTREFSVEIEIREFLDTREIREFREFSICKNTYINILYLNLYKYIYNICFSYSYLYISLYTITPCIPTMTVLDLLLIRSILQLVPVPRDLSWDTWIELEKRVHTKGKKNHPNFSDTQIPNPNWPSFICFGLAMG